jgi:hypothetical protein
MFITLLAVTFVISVGVSALVARLFAKPADDILGRILADEISRAWGRYLTFAIYVVGISSGVRIWDLEKYITAPSYSGAQIVALTFERWVLEVYRTVIGSLQGIALLLLAFFVVALLAFVVVRLAEMRVARGRSEPEPETTRAADSAAAARA